MEAALSLPVLLIFVGFAYIVLFGGLSLLKREALSTQFAIEAIAITLVFSGLAAFAGISIHPVLFLFIVYLITMRVRLLADLGTLLAKRDRFSAAERLFQLATRLRPDETGRLMVRANQGVASIQRGDLDGAIATFKDILQSVKHSSSGSKLEAAAHYNLGVAYLRQNKEAQATVEFNLVVDSWPATEYARHASASLERHRRRSNPEKEE
jgi:Tfp pilus assembly protein PilF